VFRVSHSSLDEETRDLSLLLDVLYESALSVFHFDYGHEAKKIPSTLNLTMEQKITSLARVEKIFIDRISMLDRMHFKNNIEGKLQKQKALCSIKLDSQIFPYLEIHRSDTDTCPICNARDKIAYVAGWRITTSHKGVALYDISRRWRQSLDTIFTIWSPTHSIEPASLPTSFQRSYVDWLILTHPRFSNNHFHHIVVKRAFINYEGVQISYVDTLAIEALRRTINSLITFEEYDAPDDIYRPIDVFWSACSGIGKAALDLRAGLFLGEVVRDTGLGLLGELVRRGVTGRQYDSYYRKGKIPGF
jgi:hypothetical protein